MLELFGSGYVIEHCIAVYSEYSREEAFRVYMTDAVMCLGESIANAYGGQYMQMRYADLFDKEAEDERTADEIAMDIIERAGLEIIDGRI